MTRPHTWNTVSLSALPPGWITVWENGDATLSTEPCPAVMLQHYGDSEGEPSTGLTRAAPVYFEPDEQGFLAPHSVGTMGRRVALVTTTEEWERVRQSYEARLAERVAELERDILRRITFAGESGIRVQDLIDWSTDECHLQQGVARKLEKQGRVLKTYELGSDRLGRQLEKVRPDPQNLDDVSAVYRVPGSESEGESPRW